MKLSDISRNVEKSYDAGKKQFQLCSQSCTGTEDIPWFLDVLFSVKELCMTEVLPPVLSDYVGIKGKAALFSVLDAEVEVRFEQTEADKVTMHFECRMPQGWLLPLDDGKQFCVSSVVEKYEFLIGGKDIAGILTGVMDLEGISFQASGSYRFQAKQWSICLSLIQHVSLPELMKAFFGIFGIDMPEYVFPNLEISDITFSYSSKTEQRTDKMVFALQTKEALEITSHLSICEFGISITKYGDRYEYSLSGSFRTKSLNLPLIVKFRDGEFVLAVDARQGVALPSIEELAEIADLPLEGGYPEGILALPKLQLQELYAVIPTSFDSLRCFSAAVSTESSWKLFDLDGLSLHSLYFGFRYQNNISGKETGTVFVIQGTLQMENFSLNLFAGREGSAGWEFRGFMPEDSSLELSSLAVDFAGKLGIKIPSLPIPCVRLKNLDVSFKLADKSFSASAVVEVSKEEPEDILHKLFYIQASVRMESSIADKKRVFSGCFEGMLCIKEHQIDILYEFGGKEADVIKGEWSYQEGESDFMLVSLLEAFGVKEMPPVIEELSLGIRSIQLRYEISKKNMDITVNSSTFEKVILQISDTDYQAELQFRDRISLSQLPIVGTNLKLLDTFSIESLCLTASSRGDKSRQIESGVALSGNICSEPFVLQLYHPENDVGNSYTRRESQLCMTKWFELNKSFKILKLSRVGVGFRDNRITFLLDAMITAAPVSLSLMGLGLGIGLSDTVSVGFYLSGLGIDFNNDQLSIHGAFLKSNTDTEESYDGSLKIRFGDFGLLAFGSYTGDSLLVFGLINTPIGGPPAFFVTGISAGFGYNQNLRLPEVTEIKDFPLVGGAMGTIPEGTMLTRMKEYITPMANQNFLAAGVEFTSFEMAKSFALLTVSFGQRLEVSLLGISNISIPPEVKDNKTPIAFAQLSLKMCFSPDSGLFSLIAQLTSESYVLSKDCKLTGGFAFYFWFGKEHKGDFVITLGGYHPSYKKPEHYPDIPRLGFQWKASGHLQIGGEIYFALTPSVLMAGGRLSIVYQKGALKAWFVAKADFYIRWKPFYYDIQVGVSIGVSYRVETFFLRHTFTVELAADVHLWGPDFSGSARISWFIISFTVSFGDSAARKIPTVDWSEFKTSFLPKAQSGVSDDSLQPLSVTIADGLRNQKEAGADTRPIVFSDTLVVKIVSAVPCTCVRLGAEKEVVYQGGGQLGVRPIGENKKLSSALSVQITDSDGNPVECHWKLISENLPTALWSLKDTDTELICDVVSGVILTPVIHDTVFFPKGENDYIDLEKLSVYSAEKRDFVWCDAWHYQKVLQEDTISCFMKTVMSGEVVKKRNQLLEEWEQDGYSFGYEIDLGKFRRNAQSIFNEDIALAKFPKMSRSAFEKNGGMVWK